MEHVIRTPMTARQLSAIGLGPRERRRLVEEGRLRRVLLGVYVDAAIPDSQQLRAAAAALVLPPHGVVADLSAAWLWGIDAFDWPQPAPSAPLYVVSVGGADRSTRAELLGGKRDLVADEITWRDGVPVTTPIRTACDVACLRGRSRAMAALDAFSRDFSLGGDDYARLLPRYRGRRGCRQLRELLTLVDPKSESAAESWTRLRLIDAGLPVPSSQVWVTVPNWGRVRLDLAYEHLRIAIEYDGEAAHGPHAQAHDRARREALERLGWRVFVVTRHELAGGATARWLAAVQEEIAVRELPRRRQYARRVAG